MFYGYTYHVQANSKTEACDKFVEHYFMDDIPETVLSSLNCQHLVENELDIMILNEDVSYYFITDCPVENYNL